MHLVEGLEGLNVKNDLRAWGHLCLGVEKEKGEGATNCIGLQPFQTLSTVFTTNETTGQAGGEAETWASPAAGMVPEQLDLQWESLGRGGKCLLAEQERASRGCLHYSAMIS